MPKITEEFKRKQGRGKGHGASYKPWVLTRELNSKGTTAEIIDWKHGRTIHLLSQGEEYYYYVLRWDDRVTDIREQFPLELDETVKIADRLRVRHPGFGKMTMTTDLLVDYDDGTLCAYSVKDNRKSVDGSLATSEARKREAERTAEKLLIEKTYWVEKGIRWKLLYKEDLNVLRANNIRRVIQYYDEKSVHDDISRIKHLIARKKINVDMDEPIDYRALVKQYTEG